MLCLNGSPRRRLVLLAALAALAADTPGVDRHGDPLPAKARVRLGTVRLRHPGHGLIGLAAASDQLLVSVGEDNRVCWWDLASGKLTRSYAAGGVSVRAFALSRDGKFLAIVGIHRRKERDPYENVVKVLDAATGKELRQFDRGKEQAARGSLAFSSDGKVLFSVSESDTVRIEEVATGAELLREKAPAGRYAQLALSPDGKVLAVFQSKIYLWEWQSGNAPRELRVGGRGARSVAFTPDSKSILTSPDSGPEGVRVWDVATGKFLRTVAEAGRSDALEMSLSPDGRHLVTLSRRDRDVVVRDFATGKELCRWKPGDSWRPGPPVFTPDSRRLVAPTGNGAIGVREAATGKEALPQQGHGHPPSFVALLRGEIAVTAGDNPDEIDDIMRREMYMSFGAGTLSPDGSRLVIPKGHQLYVFDTATGKQALRFAQEEGHLLGLALSPDGKHLLCSSWGKPRQVQLTDGRTMHTTGDRVVCLYDLTTGKQLWRREVANSTDRIGKVAVTLDGKGYAFGVGSAPGRIEFGELLTGKRTATIEGLPASVEGLAFSPDGKRVIAGLGDTTALIWDVPPKDK
jgi:WD40 repeat protein